MLLFLEPFGVEFMQRALLGGVIVALLSAVVGTWVVLRGMAFLGEALSHGMLPGVATAVLLGLPGQLGALVAAGVMAAGISTVTRRRRIANDTAIGLLFIAMLALGVLIVSAARSTPINLTAILFGDILAMTWGDVKFVAVASGVIILVFVLWRRPLLALTLDPRIAHALRLRPGVTSVLMMAGVALAIVLSYQAVGTLLVVGMLLAPAATGALWARNVAGMMFVACVVGVFSVVVGLLVSWHAQLAAGPAIALTAALVFGVSLPLRRH